MNFSELNAGDLFYRTGEHYSVDGVPCLKIGVAPRCDTVRLEARSGRDDDGPFVGYEYGFVLLDNAGLFILEDDDEVYKIGTISDLEAYNAGENSQ